MVRGLAASGRAATAWRAAIAIATARQALVESALAVFRLARETGFGGSPGGSAGRDAIITILIAGHDSTALALVWVMVEITLRP